MVKQTKTIEIDLEVHRLIETNRLSFDEPEGDILRRMVGLKPLEKQKPTGKGLDLGHGVILPDDTLLRGMHNRVEHQAEIIGGWILLNGKRYKSPSGAATAIRGYPENGWRFLQVKRPQDSEWVPLKKLRKEESIAKKRRNWKGLINLSKEELAEFD